MILYKEGLQQEPCRGEVRSERWGLDIGKAGSVGAVGHVAGGR